MTDPDNQTSTGAYKSFLALGRGFRLAFAASVKKPSIWAGL